MSGCQYDVNAKSDASFIKGYLEGPEITEDPPVIITDSAYASEAASKLATEKNAALLTAGLLGRKPKEILGLFELDGTGHMAASCPAGNVPKSGSYIEGTDSIRASFHKHQCGGCPCQGGCNPLLKEGTSSLLIPLKSRRRVIEPSGLMYSESR